VFAQKRTVINGSSIAGACIQEDSLTRHHEAPDWPPQSVRLKEHARSIKLDVSNHQPLTVGIIGAGEMGAAVGQRLRERGARVITTLHGRSPASVERVGRAGLETAEEQFVEDARMRRRRIARV